MLLAQLAKLLIPDLKSACIIMTEHNDFTHCLKSILKYNYDYDYDTDVL